MTSIKEFWSLVDRSGGPDACWKWLGRCNDFGYGQLTWKGKTKGAHIVSWELTNGKKLPKGTLTRHTCEGGGTRNCCNPNHLVNGTHKQNMKDMAEAGRACKGEDHPRTKLTIIQVQEILQFIEEGLSNREIVNLYGDLALTTVAINSIRTGRSWSHVSGIVFEGNNNGPRALKKSKRWRE